MSAAALIVFREVLEAALVIAIVMAATQTLPHRRRWIILGIASGIVGASVVAVLTTIISSLFEGAGQDIVNATILFLAVLLISWHVIWMNSHGRQMAADMRAVGKSVTDGERHMSVLAIVVGLAVMREGSEIVLLLQGLWSAGSTAAMVGGAVLGLTAGLLAGGLIYSGFVVLPIARVFALTNVILVLIAAGMAAHGANFLTQAGLMPALGSRLWDTSGILSDQSSIGAFLGALTGYIARPSGVEVLFYAATVLIIMALMWNAKRVVAMALVVIMVGGFISSANAKSLEVRPPQITQGEAKFEQQGEIS